MGGIIFGYRLKHFFVSTGYQYQKIEQDKDFDMLTKGITFETGWRF